MDPPSLFELWRTGYELTRIGLLGQSEATADPPNSRSFGSIRGCLFLVGCGYAALVTSVQDLSLLPLAKAG